MSKKIIKTIYSFIVIVLWVVISFAAESKWIAVGDLHSWFSEAGSEIELGRTGLIPDQQDGLRWPAQFQYQDIQAAKSMWIGCTIFNDPVADKTFDHKVVHVGPRGPINELSEMMPETFLLHGKFNRPDVYVDNSPSGKIDYLDYVNGNVDPTLPADRIIENVINTSLGLTVNRTIYAFTHRNHSNYFIYEYVLENTGIIDVAGTVNAQTLTDVVLYFQYRYAAAREGGPYGVDPSWLPQSAAWGANQVHDYIYTHPTTAEPFRAGISWNGLHSSWGGGGTNLGGPNHIGDGHLGAPQFSGTITLHADTSPTNPTDDPSQPITTWEYDSDGELSKNNNQYDGARMDAEYALMTEGRPELSHSARVGSGFADAYTSAGGASTSAGYGPYTINPGESVRIVIAEAVAGLSRQTCFDVGAIWLENPGNNDAYKNEMFFTGRDSLIKAFEMAKLNFEADFDLPHPSPPPEQVFVSSGGDRISLRWSNNAESWTGSYGNQFGGYRVYRAIHKSDTTYEKIFECGLGTDNPQIANTYDDKSAIRGVDYYYYISSFDDGSTVDGTLESSKFYTMTNQPVHLLRPPGSRLKDIRIVPNPYNILAKEMQFGKSAPDRIMFYNIPPFCEIKIFTERGDLIKTIDHNNGSGDEAWNSITSSRQTVVSGVYIAHIRVTQDYTDESTGKMIFKKGDSIIKKLAIVR